MNTFYNHNKTSFCFYVLLYSLGERTIIISILFVPVAALGVPKIWTTHRETLKLNYNRQSISAKTVIISITTVFKHKSFFKIPHGTVIQPHLLFAVLCTESIFYYSNVIAAV